MVENLDFASELSDVLKQHLAICKCSLDKNSYVRRIAQLHDIDQYFHNVSYKAGDPISEKQVNDWIQLHSHLADRTIMTYVSALRRFLTFYSQSTGTAAYIPPLHKFDDIYIPYYFTDEDMEMIYNLVDSYEPGISNTIPFIYVELPLIIRLLDSNGFRLNELLAIRMEHVDLDYGVFRMVNTKNNRQRYVPLSDEMTIMVRQYSRVMGLRENTVMCLFPRRNPFEPLHRGDVTERFRKILVKAGIRAEKSEKRFQRGPCVHCLRHRFVLKSIKLLLAHGICLEDTVPYLSLYLGHDSISETEKYLKFAADLFPEELSKFDSASAELLPDEKIWFQ